MDFQVIEHEDKLEIIIKGIIGTIEETAHTKQEIAAVLIRSQEGPVSIRFVDTHVITSSLIGYLIKSIRGDNHDITIHADNEQLYNLLERLNLLDILHVKKP